MKGLVVTPADLSQFIAAVKSEIARGWEPIGGLSVADGWYNQAMVKYQNPTPVQIKYGNAAWG